MVDIISYTYMDILPKQYFRRILGVRFGDIYTKTSIPRHSYQTVVIDNKTGRRYQYLKQKLRERQRDKRTANQPPKKSVN